MTRKQAEVIARILQKYLPPQYACKGPLLFATPVESIVRGIYLESRGSAPDGFYVWVFAQPTFIVASQLSFNLGRRLGGGAHIWSTKIGNWEEQLSAAITREALPVLQRLNQPTDLEGAASEWCVSGDGGVQRILAYSYARVGEPRKACRLLEHIEATANRTIKWQADRANEARMLREVLANDPERAKAILLGNEKVTITNLRLEKYYHTSVCEP